MQKSKLLKSIKPVIAIDGTAGSGKGTLAKNLSKALAFDHLDTGLLYRICALEILEKKINIEKIDIELWLKRNKDLSVLRTDKVSIETSRISKKKNVRKYLLKFQKNFGNFPPNGKGSVVDGRDIGSIVFPNADVKFYVDAKPEIRAKRRLKELRLSHSYYNKILSNLVERDHQDRERKNSPLIKTKDSFLIDTTNLSEKAVLDLAITILKKNTEIIK